MRAIVKDGARVALGRESEAIRDAQCQIIGSTVLNGGATPRHLILTQKTHDDRARRLANARSPKSDRLLKVVALHCCARSRRSSG
jgi:hypothetical protein